MKKIYDTYPSKFIDLVDHVYGQQGIWLLRKQKRGRCLVCGPKGCGNTSGGTKFGG